MADRLVPGVTPVRPPKKSATPPVRTKAQKKADAAAAAAAARAARAAAAAAAAAARAALSGRPRGGSIKAPGVGVAAGGLWTPKNLIPELWLDAADSSTVTLTPATNFVIGWADKGLQGNNFTATGSERPTYNLSTRNSHKVFSHVTNCYSFNTVKDWRWLHDGTTKYMICMVAQMNGNNYLMGNIDQNVGQNGALLLNRGAGNLSYVVQGGGDWPDGPIRINSAGPPLMDNSWHISTVIADPGNATMANRASLELDNGTKQPTNTAGVVTASAVGPKTLYIGAGRNNGGTPVGMWTGEMGEVVIVRGALATEANRDKLVAYMRTKWAI
jgi:hypothetical protein